MKTILQNDQDTTGEKLRSKPFELVLSQYYTTLPYATARTFYDAGHKRIILHLYTDDHATYSHSALKYSKKQDQFQVMVGKRYRQELNVDTGDTVMAYLTEDRSKYQAPMPEELEAVLLSDYDGFELFESLKPGLQRNIIFYIHRFKDSQKRIDRSLLIMERLKQGTRSLKELTKAG